MFWDERTTRKLNELTKRYGGCGLEPVSPLSPVSYLQSYTNETVYGFTSVYFGGKEKNYKLRAIELEQG